MNKLITALFVALVLAFPALASNVSFHSEVVTGFDPNDYDSQVNVQYHNDVAVNVHAGHQNVKVFAVSEPQYCSHNQMVVFVGAQHVSTQVVRVVVQAGIFRRLGIFRNQTVVNCVKVANGKVVAVKQVAKVNGFLVGNNARRVKVAVQACR